MPTPAELRPVEFQVCTEAFGTDMAPTPAAGPTAAPAAASSPSGKQRPMRSRSSSSSSNSGRESSSRKSLFRFQRETSTSTQVRNDIIAALHQAQQVKKSSMWHRVMAATDVHFAIEPEEELKAADANGSCCSLLYVVIKSPPVSKCLVVLLLLNIVAVLAQLVAHWLIGDCLQTLYNVQCVADGANETQLVPPYVPQCVDSPNDAARRAIHDVALYTDLVVSAFFITESLVLMIALRRTFFRSVVNLIFAVLAFAAVAGTVFELCFYDSNASWSAALLLSLRLLRLVRVHLRASIALPFRKTIDYTQYLLKPGGIKVMPEDSRDHILSATELDQPVRQALLDGSIRLLKCDWLISPEADMVLRVSTGDGYFNGSATGVMRMRRRQELPDDAFFECQEADRLFWRGDRSVLVLSYGWETVMHSDPDGVTLAEVRRYLQNEPTTAGCALFWDFASRPQGDCTDIELEQGQRALGVMSRLYASVRGTTVLQEKRIPNRSENYDGLVRLFNLPPELCNKDALRKDVSRFGTVIQCDFDMHTRASKACIHATIRFRNHTDAQSAVFALKHLEGRKAALFFNSTPYEGEGGRGWCAVEKGAASVVIAHLNAVPRPLPPRLAAAEARRAKMIDITAGGSRVVELSIDPSKVLEVVNLELALARFSFDSDRELAETTMLEFELAIKRAIRDVKD